MLIGACKALSPGSNALVVRTEQLETVSASAFDTVINLDNANRGFWITNAPAFHGFCEWLRTPVPIGPSLSMRRGLALIKLVDDAKIVYKSNLSQSNALLSAIADLQGVANQASSWAIIIQTPTPTP